MKMMATHEKSQLIARLPQRWEASEFTDLRKIFQQGGGKNQKKKESGSPYFPAKQEHPAVVWNKLQNTSQTMNKEGVFQSTDVINLG